MPYMERINFRKCPKTGKNIFDSVDAALMFIDSVTKRRAKEGAERVERRIYRCDHCEGYHTTSMSHKEYSDLVNVKRKQRRKRIELEAEYWEQRLKK